MASLIWFDPGEEETFTLKRGHKLIEVGYSALRNYAMEGRRSVNGAIEKLRVCRLPSGVGTTLEEYRRFITRLNAMQKTGEVA